MSLEQSDMIEDEAHTLTWQNVQRGLRNDGTRRTSRVRRKWHKDRNLLKDPTDKDPSVETYTRDGRTIRQCV